MLKLIVPILVLALIIAILAGGLLYRPAAFRLPVAEGPVSATIEIPRGLPDPVRRYYEAKFGGPIPNIATAVFVGRGRIRPFGIWMPARFVFAHRAGKDYRHYFEVTWFGIPFMRVNEGYVDGSSFMAGPMGNLKGDPNTNQGANLALWAEAGWFPSIWLTDPRVQWKPVDGSTALLYVPFGQARESFVVRFDPETGLMASMESMRFREPGDGGTKILWITRDEKPSREGLLGAASATWLDQGKPWAYFELEGVAFNADIDAYLRGRGR